MTGRLSGEHGVDDLPGHVHGFALMHRAMRRDAHRLVTAAPTLAADKMAKAARWWHQVRAVIDWHYHTEDDLLWPALRSKVPAFARTESAMHDDHAALDAAMDAVTSALSGGDRTELVSAAARFDAIIQAHLRAEEDVVLPVFCFDMTRREYLAIEREVMASASPSLLAFLFPWMLDSFSRADTAGMIATVPPPVRLIGMTVLQWRYQRQWCWW